MKDQSRNYFNKYAWLDRLIKDFTPPDDLEMVVVIPSFMEDKIEESLQSLVNCNPLPSGVVILVLINEPENASQEVSTITKQSLKKVQDFSGKSPLKIIFSNIQLPHKKAGVGLARKIGMDEAASWFYLLSKSGIIVCFDADCKCDPNYLAAIKKHYSNKKINAGLVYYEHPLVPDNGIVSYELFLRYYTDGLRFAGLPYAYQTLGSCITLRSDVYCKIGGMNVRKAGEDFYFLNKLIPQGGFFEINNTTVYPSSRISERVPFGTGRALGDIAKKRKRFDGYSPKTFEDLKILISTFEEFFNGIPDKLPESVLCYFDSINFENQLKKIQNNASSKASFIKSFSKWFDGFHALKFIHFTRENFNPDIPIEEATNWLNREYWKIENFETLNQKERLLKIRELNRTPFIPGQTNF